MANYNLDNYETVKQRKLRFYKDHPDGRIIVRLLNEDTEEKAVFCAEVFLNAEDQKNGAPRATGHALEIRDKELKKSNNGKSYESVNFTSWLENAEESAVGRALDNAGYASNARCSQEEIKKAEKHKEQFSSAIAQPMNDYVFTFGKFKGQSIKDVGYSDALNYLNFMKNSNAQKGVEDGPKVKEVQAAILKFFPNEV